MKAALGLPIAGLVSDQPLAEVMRRIERLNAAARKRALRLRSDAPFMTLSFLSLSPIPELKLTDQGLIDAVKHAKDELVRAGGMTLDPVRSKGVSPLPEKGRDALVTVRAA